VKAPLIANSVFFQEEGEQVPRQGQEDEDEDERGRIQEGQIE